MRRRKKKADFSKIIINKKLPIATLDPRWHELFPDEMKTFRIKMLEQKVNQLLKTQGKLVNDIKDMKKLKKSLIANILVNMDIKNDIMAKSKEKKLEQNKRFITELNEKIDDTSEKLAELPYLIKQANEELVLESIRCCYERISDYQERLSDISEWIEKTRGELKKKILEKHDMETSSKTIYTYMHDVLGSEVMDTFDVNIDALEQDSETPNKD